jgi:hypothetical protein
MQVVLKRYEHYRDIHQQIRVRITDLTISEELREIRSVTRAEYTYIFFLILCSIMKAVFDIHTSTHSQSVGDHNRVVEALAGRVT